LAANFEDAGTLKDARQLSPAEEESIRIAEVLWRYGISPRQNANRAGILGNPSPVELAQNAALRAFSRCIVVCGAGPM